MPDLSHQHLRYFCSHVGKSFLWVTADLVTIYALVVICKVDAPVAGWLFLTGMFLNALADAAVGKWLDRYPHMERHLATAGLAIACATFPMTILAAPSGTGGLLAATAVFRIAYSALDVPHNALLGRLGATPVAAMRLSRMRTLGTGIAAGIVGMILGHAPDIATLIILLLSISIISAVLGSLFLPMLRKAPQPPIDTASRGEPGTVIPWSFLMGSVIGFVGLAALSKALFHLPAPSLAPETGAGSTLILLTVGRTLAALLPVRPFDRRRGLMLVAGCFGAALLAIATVTAIPNGAGAPLALGLAMGAANLAAWAILPSLGNTAVSFARYTMTIKLALGVSGLLMTTWLGGRTAFATADFMALAGFSALSCILAASLIWPGHRRTHFRSDSAAAR